MDRPLEQFATIVRGVTFAKSDGSSQPSDGLLPVIRAGSIQQELLVDKDQIWIPRDKISEKQLIRKDDIVMCTSSGSADLVGKCAKAVKAWNGSFGAFCAGIRPKKGVCDPSFLYHYLSSPKFRNWSKGSSGANIKNIRASELAKFPVPNVPMPEQKRIAAILDKADTIRRKRQQAIELADQFLHSVFLDLFGDPVTNPKGWGPKSLGGFLRFLTSGSRGWAKYYRESGAKFIRIQNVGKNRLLLDDLAYVDAPDGAEADRTRVDAGDVLLSITADLGRAAVVTEDVAGAHINQHLALLRVDPTEINPRYLSAYLASNGGVHQFEAKNRSAVKSGLNFEDIRTLTIPLPPIDLQRKYDDIYMQIMVYLKHLNQSSDLANQVFNSTSQMAFAGEL